MIRISPKEVLFRVAILTMWIALLVLVYLQFRWSAELERAFEQRLRSSLSNSAEGFRNAFQSDLTIICRSIQDHEQDTPLALPLAPMQYRLYSISANLASISRYDPSSGKFEAIQWPENWAGLKDEMSNNIEDLATISNRRWFSRPWVASAIIPGFFRSRSDLDALDEEPTSSRLKGFYVVELDLPTLQSTYFPSMNRRIFNGSVVASRAVVSFLQSPIFNSHGNETTSRTNSIHIDLLAPAMGQRFAFRPAGETSSWSLDAELRSGTLEAAVTSLRLRNLAIGLGVAIVLFAGSCFLVLNARRAEQLSRQQTEFVAGFSHELRTPITAINMLAGNLRDGLTEDPVQVRKYGELILEQGNRLRVRIEDILGFAAGKNQSILLRPVSVPQLVDEVLSEERSLLQNFIVATQFDPDLPMALADAEVLKSCLANLLSNAAKYARHGGWIGVSVTDGPGGMLALTVSDRGPGIAATELTHIFKPFFRGQQARASRASGSGLGLHLVRTRIEMMGGRIMVSSEEGSGASFKILLRSTSE